MIYFSAVCLISSVISAPQTCVVLKPWFLFVLTVYCMPLFCFVDIVDSSGIFIAFVSFEITTFKDASGYPIVFFGSANELQCRYSI